MIRNQLIWVTGDLHLYHVNIIKYCDRPFFNVEHMASAIIGNWNERVSPDDAVYVLGDFGYWKGREEDTVKAFDRLNGHKYLVKGNHDKKFICELPWDEVIEKDTSLSVGGEKYVILSHEGHGHEDRDYPVFQAHVHEIWKMQGNRLNVGVDVWHFRPVLLERAYEYWNYRWSYYRQHGRDA